MYNIRTIANWAIFSMVVTFIISIIAVFDEDQVAALVIICYGHLFLTHMTEREYAHKRLKKYQKALAEATELIRSTEHTDNAYEK